MDIEWCGLRSLPELGSMRHPKRFDQLEFFNPLNIFKNRCLNLSEVLLAGQAQSISIVVLILFFPDHDKTHRFNELRKRLPGLSHKMLTQQLRA